MKRAPRLGEKPSSPSPFERRTRSMVIFAQDPSVRMAGRILRAKVAVPYEAIANGPTGARVMVVDFDLATNTLYAPATPRNTARFATAKDSRLLTDPRFHAQNAYAIAMRTLARAERALGRRVEWGFKGHQLFIAPHAFQEENAFYSEPDHGLFFGYFLGPGGRPVVTSLSHDVVAHETTHAILDGLRDCYTDESILDQAAFHEGFADIVALLSVFSMRNVAVALLQKRFPRRRRVLTSNDLTSSKLRTTALFGLAEMLGNQGGPTSLRSDALRNSTLKKANRKALYEQASEEPHARGEILVAAVMNALIRVWRARLVPYGDTIPFERACEEGADAAETLLTMMVRALDYCPPVDLSFSEFLSAALTADIELQPDDSRYHYRATLRETFADWGIEPASSHRQRGEIGFWRPPPADVSYDNVHFDSLQRDETEVFRFVWDNWDLLGLYSRAFTRVNWVRPCVRVGPDGFVLRETVAEYTQSMLADRRELRKLNLEIPDIVEKVYLTGGGTLIFNEFGRVKYHVANRLKHQPRQQAKIDRLFNAGVVDSRGRLGVQMGPGGSARFAQVHRTRMLRSRGGA